MLKSANAKETFLWHSFIAKKPIVNYSSDSQMGASDPLVIEVLLGGTNRWILNDYIQNVSDWLIVPSKGIDIVPYNEVFGGG